MKKLLWWGVLALMGGSPAMANLIVIGDGQVTIELYSDVSAAAGDDFHWQFSVQNDTSYYLNPTGFDTAFLSGSVTLDLTDFNAAYSGTYGVAPGELSATYEIAYYTIPNGASGAFGPGSIFLYFDLYRPDPFDYVPGEAEFELESVTVTGGPPSVPEPAPGLLCLGALAMMAWRKLRQA